MARIGLVTNTNTSLQKNVIALFLLKRNGSWWEYAKKKDTDTPLNPDSDGDGLNDGAEISANANPLHPDTDQDGIKDGSDIEPGNILSPNPEGFNLSITSDFSDPDVNDGDYSTGDTVHILVWTDRVDMSNFNSKKT